MQANTSKVAGAGSARRILGLDVGEARIGVALSDPLGILAQPVTIIPRDGQEMEAIAALVAEHDAAKVVVGLPRTLRGEVGPQAEKTLAFVQELRQRLSIPVETWDERLSTRAAQRQLAEAGVKARKRKGLEDALAAAFILQGYLDWAQPRPTA